MKTAEVCTDIVFKLGEWNNSLSSDGSFDHCFSFSTQHPPPFWPHPFFVFLHVSVLDIDQLNRIMLLVGNPGPELLTKISSDSVSVTYHPAHSCHCPLLPVLVLHLRQTRWYSTQKPRLFGLFLCFLMAWFCSCAFSPTSAMNYKKVSQCPNIQGRDLASTNWHNPASCLVKVQKSPFTHHPTPHTNFPNYPNHPMLLPLHVTMALNSESLDINQLQQIMRLTGTPPASLISRMPSHEVRLASRFSCLHSLVKTIRSAFKQATPPQLEIDHQPADEALFKDKYYESYWIVFYRVLCQHINLCSHSTHPPLPLWLTVFVSVRLPRVLCQCILMSFSVATRWFRIWGCTVIVDWSYC